MQSVWGRFRSAWDVQRFRTARKYNLGRRKGLCRYGPTGKWETGATSFVGAPCQANALYCIVVYCSLGEGMVSVMGAEDGPAGAGQDGGSTEDERLWTVFQGLVDDHGRTRAARVLGVNYRTVVANLEAGRLSRRMRSALQAYQESEAEQPEEAGRRVAEPEEAQERPESVPAPAAEESVGGEWQLLRWVYGLPKSEGVTLEPQADEEHAFGPAAGLVAEWRELRTGGTSRGSGVEQARAEERRWELEVLLIEEYGLTLPPDSEPLQRDDHLRWRREALAHARRQRLTAERWATVRKVLTLGLWQG